MISGFAQQDDGQALVIAGLAMVVLMGALVLSVDWGYRLATGRAAQNQADAAAFAAGRALVTSFDGSAFAATEEQIWAAACNARNANLTGAPARATLSLSVSFLDVGGAQLARLTSSSETCTLAGATTAPRATAFVRAESSSQFASLFGMLTRQQLQASASARVRLTAGAAVRQLQLPAANSSETVGAPGVGLSGASTAPNAAIWPIVIRYPSSLWPSGFPTDVTLIGNGSPAPGVRFVTLAHFSSQEARAGRTSVHQLVTESDYTGTNHGHHGHPPTPLLVNQAAPLCGGLWDTNGYASLTNAGLCDIPNWFYYGYGGSLSVSTNWRDSQWSAFESYSTPGLALPRAFNASPRESCGYRYAAVASCPPTNDSGIGDWLETVPTSNVNMTAVLASMRAFIYRYGRQMNVGGQIDQAVVVSVFVWDCSESFSAGSDSWQMNGGSGDCSTAADSAADRVHLIAAVPMTFALSHLHDALGPGGCQGQCVDGALIRGRLGAVFSDAGTCAPSGGPPCALNPLINSAFLVPDE